MNETVDVITLDGKLVAQILKAQKPLFLSKESLRHGRVSPLNIQYLRVTLTCSPIKGQTCFYDSNSAGPSLHRAA